MSSRLQVWLHGVSAGWLVQKENGNLQFRYHEQYLERPDALPISQALPLQGVAFPHRTCLAVFGGVLPEQDVRRAVAQLLGVSEANDYRLLEELGGDCAGAVEFHLEHRRPQVSDVVRELDRVQLDRILVELPRRPLAVDDVDPAPRMSLAGAQGKLPVTINDAVIAIPEAGGPPTTHILKPEPDRFEGLVDNEHFCMSLAREIGLSAAPTRAATTRSGLRYLVVERFDRDRTLDPARRLHQEDVCQALGRLPSEKYQAEGGPGVVETVELLRSASAAPAQDLPRFWTALVLNVLVGNCDAHGKNYSLLYDTARPTLAPLYDVVATSQYPELTKRLSMSIDGARMLDDVDLESWERCARECGLSPRYAVDLVRTASSRALEACERLMSTEEHDNGVAAAISDEVLRRAARWGAV